jgi:hypothetical protein
MTSASGTASVARPTTANALVEVAAILSAGILRLHARSALRADTPPQLSPDSTPTCLEVPAETVLSVHTG